MRRSTPLPALVLLGVALLWSVTSCAQPAPKPGYTPVPDKQLYSRIAELPGVAKVDISYQDDLDDPATYVGEINLAPRADPEQVLDQAMAILRQGRFRALMALSAYPPTSPAIYSDTVAGHTRDDLDTRYGPQPGSGQPPDPQ